MSEPPGRSLPPVRYASGPGTAVVGPNGLALISGPPDSAVVTAIEAPLAEGKDAAALVEALFALGMDALMPFACAVPDGDGGVKVIARGEVTAEIVTGDGVETVDGSDTSTWVETRVADVYKLALRLPAATDKPAFTLAQGTGPAAVVSVELRELPAARAENVPPTGAGTPTTTPTATTDPADGEKGSEDSTQTLSGAVAEQDDADFDFGHLLGETRHRGVEDAA